MSNPPAINARVAFCVVADAKKMTIGYSPTAL
jgi:hypothetical protein